MLCALLLAMQQGPLTAPRLSLPPTPTPTDTAAPFYRGATTPPSGDTIGYWQQHVHYTIVATLDEPRTRLHSTATLVYVNNSPDTLREMFFYQYLNAFRPGSKWTQLDTHENVLRFQNLRDPNNGYERFTTPPLVDGAPVFVDYPGAPDSTVAHIALPHPLAPHDSVRITLAWDARPPVVPRRSARRGRTWDFAQWYPKVADYDRGGWEINPFQPAGELYGEYGTYDVTMVVRDDQVIGSTGVPVGGDPGWARVARMGAPRVPNHAYADVPPAPQVDVPAGYRAVRFYAENVHHFAWTASPDYIYEGGEYIRSHPASHYPTWDTVAINVLYKPGDDTTWGGGRAVERTIHALQWLESIWGPYAYPAMTNLHRIEGGGTEFPMMVMNGGASQSLILHEVGHNFTYGILGNNEWRSGWMDEGLTSYQTSWALGQTPQEEAKAGPQPPPLVQLGYRGNGLTMSRAQAADLSQFRLDLAGRAQPIGTNSKDFSEFGVYNQMIYNRASLMYGQLRDVLGDSVFRAFFHDYYTRWALKHVDERAMLASAERVSGQKLGWFFDQWIHGTGVLDYGIRNAHVVLDGARDSSGAGALRYHTRVEVVRNGEYRHPMPVGVRTADGWTYARGNALLDAQTLEISTASPPLEVRLDPQHLTWDWDRRNDLDGAGPAGLFTARWTPDWPFLQQEDREHLVVAARPELWYGDPEGMMVGARARSSYLDVIDQYSLSVGLATRGRLGDAFGTAGALSRLQFSARGANPYVPVLFSRPVMGLSGGLAYLDGILKWDAAKSWDLSPFYFARGPAIHLSAYATGAYPTEASLLPEQWSYDRLTEVGASGSYRTLPLPDSSFTAGTASLGLGVASGISGALPSQQRGYLRAEGSVSQQTPLLGTARMLGLRLYGGYASNAPAQRSVYASSSDPLSTFENNWWRPRGAILKRAGVDYLPLGGAGLRGFSPLLPLDRVLAANGDLGQRLGSARGTWGNGSVWVHAFADAGVASPQRVTLTNHLLFDAGVGVSARGRLYDKPLVIRLDAPFFVNQQSLSPWTGLGGNGSFAPRWTISFTDFW
jgi:hypothetical protein